MIEVGGFREIEAVDLLSNGNRFSFLQATDDRHNKGQIQSALGKWKNRDRKSRKCFPLMIL